MEPAYSTIMHEGVNTMARKHAAWPGVGATGISIPAVGLLLVALAPGCRHPVGVDEVDARETYAEVTRNALHPGVPSVFSRQLLGRLDLIDRFEDEPGVVLGKLHQRLCQRFRRETLFALAELSILHAEATGRKEHYLAGVVYSFLYLFHDRFREEVDLYDPRFRLVCDLYNLGLGRFLRQADGSLKLASGTFPLPFGELEVVTSRPGFPWGPDEFHTFRPSWDYAVRGLRIRLRNPGLGAPLIAIREPAPEQGSTEATGSEPGDTGRKGTDIRDYLPPNLKVAATAFLRISADEEILRGGSLSGSLEIYASFNTSEIEVAGSTVPLETDLTTPLAFGLETSEVWDFEVGAFFSQVFEVGRTGLFMLSPYSSEKIPVVFVHGTASSPARWAEMFNDLLADREIRERYQFWFFMYTTGNPIAYSALLLRERLQAVVQAADPGGADYALRQMVVIGHSQGGLLTKMMAIDTGNAALEQMGIDSLDELDLREDHEELVRKALIFERVPQVRRVVFISTPHRGSFLAANWLGRLAASFISLPGNVRDAARDVAGNSKIPRALRKSNPTSVMNMDPDSSFLQMLVAIPVPPEVGCHSIIPVKGSGPLEEQNDGVVEYKSAHIEEAESEFVVRWNHSCQSHPLVVQEVARILHQHLRECAPAPPSAE